MNWDTWWLWVAAGIGLAILEVIVPGFIFLGFAIGATVVGLLLLVGGPLAGWLAGAVSLKLLVFALASLVAWLVLRRIEGVRRGQVKTFDTDINED